MNYNETLQFLFDSLPMYQRIGTAAYKADLENTNALMELTNHPYNRFRSIHVAGTNGKGSVSHMLASIFQEAGFKTGLYTSPHLVDFRERIQINGEKVSEEYICQFVEQHYSSFLEIKPSFFEMTVAMAFDYFAKEKVDIAIIETGMGGRLDSTNVISPLLSIITNIGFDHTQFLGNTISKIAFEKAGIIKPQTPVLVNEYSNDSRAVFIEKANQENAPIYFAEQLCTLSSKSTNPFTNEISAQTLDWQLHLKSPLAGDYQLKNTAGVIAAISILNKHYEFKIKAEEIQKGIENVIKNTNLMGRWQCIQQKPMIVCDTGHNQDGLSLSIPKLQKMEYEQLHIILGMVNDKEIYSVLELFPKSALYYFCKASIPRALDASILKEKAQKQGLNGSAFSNVEDAIQSALKESKNDDLIFIGGSTFVVADALMFFNGKS